MIGCTELFNEISKELPGSIIKKVVIYTAGYTQNLSSADIFFLEAEKPDGRPTGLGIVIDGGVWEFIPYDVAKECLDSAYQEKGTEKSGWNPRCRTCKTVGDNKDEVGYDDGGKIIYWLCKDCRPCEEETDVSSDEDHFSSDCIAYFKENEVNGYMPFDGGCDDCLGWDGESHRCQCGNRRVTFERYGDRGICIDKY